ncbi:MAG TPA: energy transducer TonB [Steroidobacteraceae bacterium]
MAVSLELDDGSTAPPRREGSAPVRERLTAMLLLTALLHAIILLGVSFSTGAHGGRSPTPELDVLLVTDEVPQTRTNEHAAYLAQRTQVGAGNTDRLRVASPASRGALSAPRSADSGADPEDSRWQREAMQPVLASSAPSADVRYIGTVSPSSAGAQLSLPVGDTEGDPRSGRGDAVELMLKGRPDARHWVTPDTRASNLAPYLAAWKRKVERVGTLNFPAAARNAGLSGSPVVEVQIGANGKLLEASVRRSSGHGSLDQAAMSILELASPFDPFPPELAAEYARLRFAYQWDFVAGALQTGAVTASSDTATGP